MKIVKYLVEEEVRIIRQGIIEIDVEDKHLQETLKLNGKLSDEDKEEEIKDWAIGLFQHSLDVGTPKAKIFADTVEGQKHFDGDVSAKRIDSKSPTYLDRLPILKMKYFSTDFHDEEPTFTWKS
tara:strand:+ start:1697 stop:2068 length:372 start_codon:yes stop_codon:yes gene_type:complete